MKHFKVTTTTTIFGLIAVSICSTIEAASAELHGDHENLAETIQKLQNTIELMQGVVEMVPELKAQIEAQQIQIRDQQREINELRDSADVGQQLTTDSMFLATISEASISIDSDDVIVWDSAPINPGGHYNTILGAYTAPVSGYYQFSVNKEGNNYQGSFYILVDELRYAVKDAYAGDSNVDPSGSATVAIELQAGQIVRIQNTVSTVIFGTHPDGFIRSWFTGHLLYAL